MPTSRKPMRPRLEVSARSKVHATINDTHDEINIVQEFDGETVVLTRSDAKRLHAFLAKAIAYLSQHRARKGGAR